MKFESKKEMAQALLNGRKFKSENGKKIYFNEEEGFMLPMNYVGSTWDLDEGWTEIKEWYEDIPEDGILCWVWDTDKTLKRADIIEYYEELNCYHFRSGSTYWNHAEPMTLEEVKKYVWSVE